VSGSEPGDVYPPPVSGFPCRGGPFRAGLVYAAPPPPRRAQIIADPGIGVVGRPTRFLVAIPELEDVALDRKDGSGTVAAEVDSRKSTFSVGLSTIGLSVGWYAHG